MCEREKAFECSKTSKIWVDGGFSVAGGKSIKSFSSPLIGTARVLEGLPRTFSFEKPQEDAFSYALQ